MRPNFKVTNAYFRINWSLNSARDRKKSQTQIILSYANSHLVVI